MGLVKEDSGNLVTVGSRRSEGEEISGEEVLEYLGHQYETREAAKGEDGTWRVGGGAERDCSGITSDPLAEHDSYREWLASGMPRELVICDAALRRRGGEQGSEPR
jgi:hypothetical protein